MDQYAYMLLVLALAVVWAIIAAVRRDMLRKMVKMSAYGLALGAIAETWYGKDYWQPPTLLGDTLIVPEDLLFGFTITGISATIYYAVFRKQSVAGEVRRRPFFFALFIIGLSSMHVLCSVFHFNSLLVSTALFVIFTVVSVRLRTDLLLPALKSGLLSVAVVIPIYIVIFDIICGDFWSRYWLLADTPWGITLLGNIPATELWWYFTWGCLVGIGDEFSSGTKIMPVR